MTLTQKGERNRDRQLRLWPGVVAVTLQWLVRFGVPVVVPEATAFGVIGGVLGGLVVLVWWAFFSRVPRAERWGGVLLMIVAVAATPRILHPSIAGGMMGMMFGISVIPGLSLALVVWAVVGRSLAVGSRRVALVAAILAACGFWAFVQTEGVTGEGRLQLAWRWKKTPEQQLLARAGGEPAASPAAVPAPAAVKPPKTAARMHAGWPGFRGPHRDGIVTGTRIKTDWAASPPVELWRRPVGPGWSSFAVGGGLLYTQEQRGEFEVVACYDAATGKPVWTHRDTARFWESNAGAGPRGTPALHDGRIYTLGATGIVNSLDAGNGAAIWTRNAASDTGAQVPGWGFASSPLVVDDLVVVAASGRLAAYGLSTGAPRWVQTEGSVSYSSPHLLTIGGMAQIVFLNQAGATGVAPADGKALWKHPWPGGAILQPAPTADGGVLIASSDMSGGVGVRRLTVANGSGGWTAEEVWTSRGLKPYFNDFVVHSGHAFGFDGGILACIGLHDGQRKWKGGRYGHGQLLLLADQDLLLVLSEEGELALVAAVPGQFTEIARFPALEGKTWNHPVLAGDILLVRNGQEMVAFRLSLAGG
ncbi:MAG: PQQ-binding-like beta-propeller repeat protein [Acidobacteria bacterium]|nr:PQQ-binding-like beta-propeller repeat protein [Acidobacteriota bacterium]